MSEAGMVRVDELLADAVRRGALPGVAAAVAGPDGLCHVAAAGTLRVGGAEQVTPDTMFRIMSLTKALVSVAALRRVEQGSLRLEAEVASVLPAFGELQVLDGFDGDTPRLRAPARPATIRQLLTHTDGHGYWFGSEDLKRYHELTGLPNAFSGLEASLHAPLVFDPGTTW